MPKNFKDSRMEYLDDGRRTGYIIEWSPEDNVYIAKCKPTTFLSGHGDTPEKALKELMVVVNDFDPLSEDK